MNLLLFERFERNCNVPWDNEKNDNYIYLEHIVIKECSFSRHRIDHIGFTAVPKNVIEVQVEHYLFLANFGRPWLGTPIKYRNLFTQIVKFTYFMPYHPGFVCMIFKQKNNK